MPTNTVVKVDSFENTISGYPLLWRQDFDKDDNGNWYTANSNFVLDGLVGCPVIVFHEDLGLNPLEIGTVQSVSPDYYGIHVIVELKPIYLLETILFLLMREELHFSISTDEQGDVEIGEDGFVIRYPITAIAILLNPPVTGQ